MQPAGTLCWVDIPVTDMPRAIQFYSQVFGIELKAEAMMGMEMAFLPTTGTLVAGPNVKPSMEGSMPYLTAGDDLTDALSRVEPAGGKVLMPKMQISPENGHMAIFIDSEGNRIGMWSQN